MREIDIAIMTVDRPEYYLGNTLDSFNPPGATPLKANLVYGSPSNEYLQQFRDSESYTVIDFPAQEWEDIKDKDLRHRASWNYWRCLSQNITKSNGVLVFEDDVKFATGWRNRLEKTINLIDSTYGQDYVLALYAAYPFHGYSSGLLYENYGISGFYGTQGMYFPEKARTGYADYMLQNGVKSYHTPYDLLLKEYLIKDNIKLFATTPSLVQHMGQNTTGLGVWHQAHCFLDHLPGEMQ